MLLVLITLCKPDSKKSYRRKIVLRNPLIFYDLILLDIKHRTGNDIPQTTAIIKIMKLSLYIIEFIAPKPFPVIYAMGPATIPKMVE